MRWIALLLLLAGPALAADPECANPPDPILTEWSAYDGTASFCTPPTLTDRRTGDMFVLGEFATTVSCTVMVAGLQIGKVTDAGVSEKVVINHTLEGRLAFTIRCDDGVATEEEKARSVVAGNGNFSQSSRPQPTTLAPAFIIP